MNKLLQTNANALGMKIRNMKAFIVEQRVLLGKNLVESGATPIRDFVLMQRNIKLQKPILQKAKWLVAQVSVFSILAISFGFPKYSIFAKLGVLKSLFFIFRTKAKERWRRLLESLRTTTRTLFMVWL